MVVLLTGLLLAGSAAAGDIRTPEQFRWQAEIDGFGGLSGLWVAPDGGSLKAVSDRGTFVEADITRKDGRISSIDITRSGPIRERLGRVADGFMQDAEGLAIAPDGTIYISFEGHHRVRKWQDFAKEPTFLHPIKFFYHLQLNSGFEALAVDDDGIVYAIPERSGRWTRPFPVWRMRAGEVWDDDLSLKRSERYLVAGADFGPDGRLYLLEREFIWHKGFRTRIRRFVLSEDGFDDGETIFSSRFGEYDNMEGISVWRNASGKTIATLISDDNHSILQGTWLLELEID